MLVLCALMALGLAGCGGDEPATTVQPPAPPPAPPPFQPQPVEVALGENGGSVTLMTTEAGGYTLSGEAFAGGTENPVEGEGGRMYVLTLEGTTWSAAFQPAEATVALGASGDTATLITTEAGGYTLGGEAFVSGGTAMSSGGGRYTLTMGEDSMWSAAFVPMTQEVSLGTSGMTVTLMTNEAGTWMIGDSDLVADGSDRYMSGGLTYALTHADGTWSAAFVPVTQEVALGTSGSSVTLSSTEAGGYTLGGEAFVSGGTAMSSGGGRYTLTMGEDSMWSAAFVPMTQEVSLGTSGMTVTLMTNEAGTWMIGDSDLVADGSDRYMSGGLTYALTHADGTWSAAFVPVTQEVALGTSGSSVTLSSTEAGGWAVGDSAFLSGGTRRAANGNAYTLTLGADGTWMAAFAPMRVAVALGGSGETVDLWTTEGGGVTLDGQAVASGATTMNSVDETYVLSVDDAGAWSGAHQPRSASVRLGASDQSVTLTSTEAGGWTLGGEAVTSGQTVEGGANAATGASNLYELTLADSAWSAAYQAATMTIAGTGLEATAKEDGTGYTVGDGSLPATGVGTVTGPGGAMFRVAKDADGMLAGTRFDLPIEARVLKADAHTNAFATLPRLSANNPDTDRDETGTLLEAVGAKFPVGELLASSEELASGETLQSGTAAVAGPNIVAGVRDKIAGFRDTVRDLVALRRDGGFTGPDLTTQLERKWEDAEKELEKIFPAGVDLETTTSESRVVGAFDELVDALSSLEAFQAATLNNGPDKLQGFQNRDANQAREAFERVKHNSTAAFGALGSTRFGAAVYNETPRANTGHGDAERAQAFAWSTMGAVYQATDVQVSGAAYYSGATRAADEKGTLYVGGIDISVRFARTSVEGLVTDLRRVDNEEPFSYGLGGEVTSIALREAELNPNGSWRIPAGSQGDARLTYRTQAGSAPDHIFSAGTFSGRLLGRGDEAGDEAYGTWTIEPGGSVKLAGGFGAARGPDRTDPIASVAGDFQTIGKTGDEHAVVEGGRSSFAATPDAANFKFEPSGTPEATYSPARAAVLAGGSPPTSTDAVAESARHEFKKATHSKAARDAITTRLAQLRRIIALDNADASDADKRFSNSQRQRLFTEILAEIRKVFGDDQAMRAAVEGDPAADPPVAAVTRLEAVNTGVLTVATRDLSGGNDLWNTDDHEGLGGGYPVNAAGVPQDTVVLSEIEDVLAALQDQAAFEAAFGSGGVLEGLKNLEAYDASTNNAGAIFNRSSARLLMWTDSTALTRFGAWIHQRAANGLAVAETQASGGWGTFAYSQLDPTPSYTSVSDRGYPGQGATGRVTAAYRGKTVAMQGDVFLRGDVEARVAWDASAVGGRVRVTVSGLRSTNTNFGALRYGLPDTVNASGEVTQRTPGTYDVASVTFSGTIDNSDPAVDFAAETDMTVELRLETVEGAPKYRDFPALAQTGTPVVARDNNMHATTYTLADGQTLTYYANKPFTGAFSTSTDAAVRTARVSTTQVTDFSAGTGFTAPTAAQLNDLHQPHTVRYNPLAEHRNIRYTALGNVGGHAFFYQDGSALLWDESGVGPSDVHLLRSYPTEMPTEWLEASGHTNVGEAGTTLTGTLDGAFVGRSRDGPLGLMGVWTLTGTFDHDGDSNTDPIRAFGLGGNRTDEIRGAFGADAVAP